MKSERNLYLVNFEAGKINKVPNKSFYSSSMESVFVSAYNMAEAANKASKWIKEEYDPDIIAPDGSIRQDKADPSSLQVSSVELISENLIV